MKRHAVFVILLWLYLLSVAQPGIKPDETLYMYGRVNHWMDSREKLIAELDQMQQNGVDGYIIELACWGQTWNRKWCIM